LEKFTNENPLKGLIHHEAALLETIKIKDSIYVDMLILQAAKYLKNIKNSAAEQLS